MIIFSWLGARFYIITTLNFVGYVYIYTGKYIYIYTFFLILGLQDSNLLYNVENTWDSREDEHICAILIRKSKDYVYGIWVYKALDIWKGYYRVKKSLVSCVKPWTEAGNNKYMKYHSKLTYQLSFWNVSRKVDYVQYLILNCQLFVCFYRFLHTKIRHSLFYSLFVPNPAGQIYVTIFNHQSYWHCWLIPFQLHSTKMFWWNV